MFAIYLYYYTSRFIKDQIIFSLEESTPDVLMSLKFLRKYYAVHISRKEMNCRITIIEIWDYCMYLVVGIKMKSWNPIRSWASRIRYFLYKLTGLDIDWLYNLLHNTNPYQETLYRMYCARWNTCYDINMQNSKYSIVLIRMHFDFLCIYKYEALLKQKSPNPIPIRNLFAR